MCDMFVCVRHPRWHLCLATRMGGDSWFELRFVIREKLKDMIWRETVFTLCGKEEERMVKILCLRAVKWSQIIARQRTTHSLSETAEQGDSRRSERAKQPCRRWPSQS